MRYQVYVERRVSTMVEVHADSIESAVVSAMLSADLPGENLQGVDTAGDWTALIVTDEHGVSHDVPEDMR